MTAAASDLCTTTALGSAPRPERTGQEDQDDAPAPLRSAAAALAAVLALGSAACAAPRIAVPPGLQAAALLCIGEALRLCPGALQAADHGIACIRTKRRLLSAPCRTVYDQGVSFIRGGDVHLDLRALRGRGAGVPGAKAGQGAPAE